MAQQLIAQPSVQSLLVVMRYSGAVLGSATAFVVNGRTAPWLVTNRHVVTGRDQNTGEPLSKTAGIPNELVVWHNRSGRLGEWISKVEPLQTGGAPAWKEHPTLGARADFVALPLTDVTDVQLYPYDPANPGPALLVAIADAISVVGFPFGLAGGGLFAIWATGFLATEPIADFADLPVSLIDCRSRQGQSGSPVIAFRNGGMVAMSGGQSNVFDGPVWRFIGIYSGRLNADSDLGIVWKASALAELVATL
jgi:hypothetical protein